MGWFHNEGLFRMRKVLSSPSNSLGGALEHLAMVNSNRLLPLTHALGIDVELVLLRALHLLGLGFKQHGLLRFAGV